MTEQWLTESKKKIYTIRDGTYSGNWHFKMCWLKDEKGEIFYRFDTTTNTKKNIKITAVKTGIKIKVYAYRMV